VLDLNLSEEELCSSSTSLSYHILLSNQWLDRIKMTGKIVQDAVSGQSFLSVSLCLCCPHSFAVIAFQPMESNIDFVRAVFSLGRHVLIYSD
jgi:hypothetical protein